MVSIIINVLGIICTLSLSFAAHVFDIVIQYVSLIVFNVNLPFFIVICVSTSLSLSNVFATLIYLCKIFFFLLLC